ncbi:MAG: hypothetical protein IPM60_05550 [Rhodospirillales bacterium]|nr:hypothetical protein [Rhodospirillales bacterium]
MRLLLAAALGMMLLTLDAEAASPENFTVDTAEDLVALCSADPSNPNYVAAIHFCHGFGSGGYHYYKIEALANPEREFVCFKEPFPTRTAVIENFVKWAKKHPQYMENEAMDVLFRYLAETYPCAK